MFLRGMVDEILRWLNEKSKHYGFMTLWTDDPLPALASWHWQRPCELMTPCLHWLHDIDSDLVNWWPLTYIGFMRLTATLWTDDPLPALPSWHWQRPCELMTLYLHWLHDIDSDLVNWWPPCLHWLHDIDSNLVNWWPPYLHWPHDIDSDLVNWWPLTCIGFMTLTATLWTDDPLPALASWYWQRPCELMTPYLHWLHDIDSDLVNWWPPYLHWLHDIDSNLVNWWPPYLHWLHDIDLVNWWPPCLHWLHEIDSDLVNWWPPYLHWLHDIDSDLVNWWPLTCIGFTTLTATLWTDDPLPALASWHWQRPCELMTPYLHWLHDIDSDLTRFMGCRKESRDVAGKLLVDSDLLVCHSTDLHSSIHFMDLSQRQAMSSIYRLVNKVLSKASTW